MTGKDKNYSRRRIRIFRKKENEIWLNRHQIFKSLNCCYILREEKSYERTDLQDLQKYLDSLSLDCPA